MRPYKWIIHLNGEHLDSIIPLTPLPSAGAEWMICLDKGWDGETFAFDVEHVEDDMGEMDDLSTPLVIYYNEDDGGGTIEILCYGLSAKEIQEWVHRAPTVLHEFLEYLEEDFEEKRAALLEEQARLIPIVPGPDPDKLYVVEIEGEWCIAKPGAKVTEGGTKEVWTAHPGGAPLSALDNEEQYIELPEIAYGKWSDA